MPDIALCVVDVQNGFVSERSAHIPQRASACIKQFSKVGAPILLSRFVNTPDSMFRQALNSTRVTTANEIALHQQLVLPTSEHRIIDKSTYSAINAESLALLESWGTRRLAICGIATESCVLATAMDAFDHGIRPLLIADATASHISDALEASAWTVLEHNLGADSIIRIDGLASHFGSTANYR